MDSKYVDTHAHLNLSAFKDDLDEVMEKCQTESVAVVNVGTKETTSRKAVEIAEEADNCFAIIGLHPIQTVSGMHDEDEIGEGGEPFKSKGEEFNPDLYRELAKNNKVVGIGECGFDYWHTKVDTYGVQEVAFIEQIKLANELNLPLMIHTRGPKPDKQSPTGRSVYIDVYETLKTHAKVPFNVHFYAGTIDEASKFLDIGGNISFTGVVTFAKDYEEIVKWAPLDKIHGETDCPFVAPRSYRGKRCEPWMVIEVYKKIAELKNLDEELVREQLIKNARKFYNI
ncbi:TatD family hydrolase [Candidatus Kaiserbacteria bacterium]|nr:TatD family hydrolase [Candidatus Kaiserbacteria bacterium]